MHVRLRLLVSLAACLAAPGLVDIPFAATGIQTPDRVTATSGGPSPRQALTVIDGVIYEHVTVFPVVSRSAADTSGFLTLDDGLAAGEVLVREVGELPLRRSRDGRPVPSTGGAEVNRLALVNRGRLPLLLLAGEVVTGGKQDRVIAKDRIILPGGDPLPLDVFCVEQGRWTGGAQFTASKLIVHPSVREQAAVEQAQDKVWSAVRAGTTAERAAPSSGGERPALSRDAIGLVIASEAPSQSYAKVYQQSGLGRSVDSFAAELDRRFRTVLASGRRGRVVGVVVAYGGEVAWSDVFASEELFLKYWPKLVRSYVVEALARSAGGDHATIGAAKSFLDPITGREQIETEPGVYRWRQVNAGAQVRIDLEALPGGLTLHRVTIRRTT